MNDKNYWTLVPLIILTTLVSQHSFAMDNGKMEVRNATSQFYSALNTMFTGELRPMKEIWSHARDVTYMGPGGGFQVGWKNVIAQWEKQAAKKLDGEVKPVNMQITIGEKLAVVQNYEEGKNIDHGKLVKVSIRATNIFRKENGKWKMIGHHTDLIPFLEK